MSQPDRHSEALLGIHLAESARQSQGSPPSDEELALLIAGELEQSRRTEVLSHLAARPERYRQWLNLAAMEDGAEPAKPSLWQVLTRGLNNWLIDWRYAAGGIGAMAAVLLLVNQMAFPPGEAPEEVAATPEWDFAADDLAEEAPTEAYSSAPPAAKSRAKAEREEARRSMALQGAAKMVKPTTISRRCLPLSHPESDKPGLLCAVALSNGMNELRWQTSDTTAHHTLADLPEKVLQLKASDNQQWLALQSAQIIMVQRTEDLFNGDSERAQLPFNAGTASMRWEDNELIISVLQALGDSDDDLRYRYQPESGELITP